MGLEAVGLLFLSQLILHCRLYISTGVLLVTINAAYITFVSSMYK